jgi:ATP-dependent DNA ligase
MSGFSPQARKSAGTARKIKNRFGEEAYLAYKNHGIIPPGLNDLPKRVAPVASLQADTRPDTVPTPSSLGTSAPADLRALQPGDIVRDKNGQRIRVQKVLSDGLRIHDPKGGARDLPWDSLIKMDLTREVQQDGGPAARRLGDLRNEAKRLGLNLPISMTIKDVEKAIGAELAKRTGGDRLDQIDPMLASDDAKNLQDFAADQPYRSAALFRQFWDNDNIVAEEKLDGNRLKLHLTATGVRADSRRRDTKTRNFSEKSENLPHLLSLRIPELVGTVLDTEGMIPVTSGVSPVSGKPFHGSLAISTAAVNAGPDSSKLIQDTFGPLQFWVFDILRHKGEDVSKMPFDERRKLLEKVVQQIHDVAPETQAFLRATRVAEGEDKIKLYEELVSKGGEGIIFKTRKHRYQEGKRSKDLVKLKRFQEVDAYVSGYVPGKAGNEGLVGALELSVKIDGKEVPIAAVSQLTGEQRIAMSDPSGALKPEYYDRVVTFRGQEMTKNGRFRHAVFVGFREDKVKSDIDGYEVREELAKLGVLDQPVNANSAQEYAL